MFSSKMTTTCLIGVVDAAVVGGGDALDIETPSTAAPAARTPMPPAMSFFPVRNGVLLFGLLGGDRAAAHPGHPRGSAMRIVELHGSRVVNNRSQTRCDCVIRAAPVCPCHPSEDWRTWSPFHICPLHQM